MLVGYSWREVAHTLNGYEAAGSFEACADRAHSVGQRISDAAALEAISTEDLRIALFFAARAERHGGSSWEDTLREDAIVAELVRRHGAEWLDAELRKLRDRLEG